MVDFDLALRQRNLERGGSGLGALGGEELQLFEQQFADQQQRGEQEAMLDEEQARRDAEADTVAQAFLNAGLTDLAQQFQSSRRRASFDLARRGLQGGSTDVQRQAGLREQASRGVGQLFNQATAAGEQTRRQGLGAVFGLQQQVAQQNPFAGALQANLLQGIQGRTNLALGDAQAAQQMAGVNDRYSQQIGTALGFGLQTAGQAIGGALRTPPQPTAPLLTQDDPGFIGPHSGVVRQEGLWF